jgi:hypothetical protein
MRLHSYLFLWGYIKRLVYQEKLQARDDGFVQGIIDAAPRVQNNPEGIQKAICKLN